MKFEQWRFFKNILLQVEKDDGLPEFVCIHCLGYLQHAYNIRIQIRHTADNFREIRKITSERPIQLELNSSSSSSKPQTTINQQEIDVQKEELEEEKYWLDNFEKKNAKVKITTKAKDEKPILNEMKCPSCFRKSYSARSHNAHMKICIAILLERFFSEHTALYKNKCMRQITDKEYVLYAISLLFNYVEKIKGIAATNNIIVDAVVKIMPPEDLLILREPAPPPATSTNPFMHQQNRPAQSNRFTSPDYGYSSNTQ
jgi:hypothetical protein